MLAVAVAVRAFCALLAATFVLVGGCIAPATLMMFDAPGSTESPLTLAMAGAILSVPFCGVLSLKRVFSSVPPSPGSSNNNNAVTLFCFMAAPMFFALSSVALVASCMIAFCGGSLVC